MNTPKRKAEIKRQNELARDKRISQPLTKLDIELIKLIYKEHTSIEIADIFGKSRRTVENQRTELNKKIGCRNVVGVIKHALKNNLVK
ncbi:MAG: DNA-binding CsgD family transcriptional regulator [Flavobacteriaceae bacterium]|jgi:DNA-binding CsgD family transcriptional regulator